MLKLRKNKKGFTLVELIVVIAIMAVLAGVVAGVTVSQLNKIRIRPTLTKQKVSQTLLPAKSLILLQAYIVLLLANLMQLQ